MVTGRSHYLPEEVAAARSVLVELVRLLGEYRDDIVVVGGWVPELLPSLAGGDHVGTLDVDLALDHRRLQEAGYRTIQQVLLHADYQQDASQPFIFRRAVAVGDREILVQVDLLAGEYEGTGRTHRTQPVQGVRARKTRGCDLAFDLYSHVVVEGRLPDGAMDTVRLKVAGIVPFLVMKGLALHDRLKAKDAWDIYFCVGNYPGGLDALVAEFRPHLHHGLVREGLLKIHEKFASVEHVGPSHVAGFAEPASVEDQALLRRDAYEKVHYWLRELGIAK